MDELLDTEAVILHVYGRVQGVGFRYYTQKKAMELRISGYVKNRPDGSVYIEAEGKPENIEALIRWCEMGPSWARVSKVEKQRIPLRNHEGFEIR